MPPLTTSTTCSTYHSATAGTKYCQLSRGVISALIFGYSELQKWCGSYAPTVLSVYGRYYCTFPKHSGQCRLLSVVAIGLEDSVENETVKDLDSIGTKVKLPDISQYDYQRLSAKP